MSVINLEAIEGTPLFRIGDEVVFTWDGVDKITALYFYGKEEVVEECPWRSPVLASMSLEELFIKALDLLKGDIQSTECIVYMTESEMREQYLEFMIDMMNEDCYMMNKLLRKGFPGIDKIPLKKIIRELSNYYDEEYRLWVNYLSFYAEHSIKSLIGPPTFLP